MKAWIKWSLGLIALIGILGGGFAWWVYNKPHRNINNEVAVKATTKTLLDAFKQNEKTASTQYTDKVLALNGIVKEASKNEAGNWVVNIENDTHTGSITVAFSALHDSLQPYINTMKSLTKINNEIVYEKYYETESSPFKIVSSNTNDIEVLVNYKIQLFLNHFILYISLKYIYKMHSLKHQIIIVGFFLFVLLFC